MKSRLFLNVVIREGAAVFKLLAGEDQALLVWWNAFLIFYTVSAGPAKEDVEFVSIP